MYGRNLTTIPPGVDGKQALEEVRRRVFKEDGPAPGSAEAAVGYLRSEHMLVRFLIARQWDVEKACQMLKEHYKWLAEAKMSVLLADPWPEEAHIKKYYPQAYHGMDKLGRPIYIERPGLIDMPRLLRVVSPERLLQYMAVGSELQIRRRLPACSIYRGEVVDKSLNIMDLDGLGFRVVTHTTARKVLKDVVAVLQNHYPEVAGRTIIVNAPKVFSIAWSFVKPMLDEKTVAKISIFGTDKAAYSEALLELVGEAAEEHPDALQLLPLAVHLGSVVLFYAIHLRLQLPRRDDPDQQVRLQLLCDPCLQSRGTHLLSVLQHLEVAVGSRDLGLNLSGLFHLA
mmetsp:Transcript_97302/g.280777  ORF Transcript_97302/g.280777 Transcript_97302/m.280777 type:complete len:341 (-) Transcript_97302:1339-2361(-)